MNARTKVFSAELCIATRWSMLFTSLVRGFNVVSDHCCYRRIIHHMDCLPKLLRLWQTMHQIKPRRLKYIGLSIQSLILTWMKTVMRMSLLTAALSTETDAQFTPPPHYRCASHTINMISTCEVEKYLTSSAVIKSVYRTKASRSTVALEHVEEVSRRNLLVLWSTSWNSF